MFKEIEKYKSNFTNGILVKIFRKHKVEILLDEFKDNYREKVIFEFGKDQNIPEELELRLDNGEYLGCVFDGIVAVDEVIYGLEEGYMIKDYKLIGIIKYENKKEKKW